MYVLITLLAFLMMYAVAYLGFQHGGGEAVRRRRCRGWWDVVKGDGPLQEKIFISKK